MSTHSLWWFLVFINFAGYYLYSYTEIRSRGITAHYLGRIVVVLAHFVVLLGSGIQPFLLFLPFSFFVTPLIVGLVIDKDDKELQDHKNRLAIRKDISRQETGGTAKESLNEEYIGTEISLEEACDKGLVDEYPKNEMLRLLGFSVKDLDRNTVQFNSIENEIIRALKEVSCSLELKDSEFTVYVGIYNKYLWVGIPYIVQDDEEKNTIENVFINSFKKRFNDRFIIESSSCPLVSLMAAYKYNKGEISQYAGPEQLGKYRIDKETGIKIIFRLIMPNLIPKDDLHNSKLDYITVIYVSDFGKKVSDRLIECHKSAIYQNDEHFKSTEINSIYVDKNKDLNKEEENIIDQSLLILIVSERGLTEKISIGSPRDKCVVGIFADNTSKTEPENINSMVMVNNNEEAFIALRLILDNMTRSTIVGMCFDDMERIFTNGKLHLVVKKFLKDDIKEKGEYLPFKKTLMGIYGGEDLDMTNANDIVDQLFDYGSEDSLFLFNVFGSDKSLNGKIDAVVIGSYEIDDYLASLKNKAS